MHDLIERALGYPTLVRELPDADPEVMTEQVPGASRGEVERKCAELLDLLES
jgi:hypothetical protein